MLRRLLFVVATVALMSGCATAPEQVAPVKPQEPSALIVDSAAGGGRDGGAFYFLAAANGKPVSNNNLNASLSASRGFGTDLRVRRVERYVPAGKSKLKLSGQYAYAAPIQSIFHSAAGYAVEGEVDVELRPDVRYRVNGIVDAFRREVWLEEEATGQIVGRKVIGVAEVDTKAKPMASASFTCCNLHYEGDWISDTNATTLPFVPAGSRVVVQDFGRYRANVLIEGRPMRIGQDEGREQETKEQYIAKLVVKDDPNQRIPSFSEGVQRAIHAGKVAIGMTKEEVVISLGYPRTDRTRSMALSEWVYWTQDDDEFVVLWGPDERVKEIDAARKVKLLVVYTE